MPSESSGWRSPAAYAYVEDLGASDLAWEWLRRNERYARDYAIRATKARYYEDPRFTERVLSPPELRHADEPGPDDWSCLPVPARAEDAGTASAADGDEDDPTASERRLQPELARTKSVEKTLPLDNEFEIDPPDEDEDAAARNRGMLRRMRGIARQVSLNPDDGMEL